MDLETVTGIYRTIGASQWIDLRQDLVDVAIRDARARVDWLLADPAKQQEMGHDRTVTHNALIVACDILARNMAKSGEDASWRQVLGDDRKRIGDFACYLHCLLGLKAR